MRLKEKNITHTYMSSDRILGLPLGLFILSEDDSENNGEGDSGNDIVNKCAL